MCYFCYGPRIGPSKTITFTFYNWIQYCSYSSFSKNSNVINKHWRIIPELNQALLLGIKGINTVYFNNVIFLVHIQAVRVQCTIICVQYTCTHKHTPIESSSLQRWWWQVSQGAPYRQPQLHRNLLVLLIKLLNWNLKACFGSAHTACFPRAVPLHWKMSHCEQAVNEEETLDWVCQLPLCLSASRTPSVYWATVLRMTQMDGLEKQPMTVAEKGLSILRDSQVKFILFFENWNSKCLEETFKINYNNINEFTCIVI